MIYNFDTCPDRRTTESVKWGYFDDDVLPMWVADMDFISPAPVVNALQERIAHGVFGYPWPSDSMKEAVVDWCADQYNWEIEPQEVVFLTCVVNGFHLVAHAIGKPGDGVFMQTPVYHPFFEVAKNTGMIQQEMELTLLDDGSYGVDFDAFEASLGDNSRLFLLCNPHNPVGRVFRKDELERMAEICLRRDMFICSDEIHSDLIFNGQPHIPTASLSPEIARRTITLLAPSKTFNIAGLNCSVAIIQDKDMRAQMETARKGLLGGVNLLGLTAAEAAYRHGGEWLDQALDYMKANRDYLHTYVNDNLPGISMAKPEGTYLAWLDCRATALDDPSAFFIEKGRVAFNSGKMFGRGGEGFVRLNFGCPRATLKEGLERARRALESRETQL
jgi:cysteine-S-conjugate beta-lyase